MNSVAVDILKAKAAKQLTDKMPLDAREICAIIKASKNCGVSELKFGGLKVRFFDPASSTRHVEPTFSDYTDNSASSAEMDKAPPGGRGPAEVPKGILQDFAESQLLIDDSIAFETQMIDRLGDVAEPDEAVQRK